MWCVRYTFCIMSCLLHKQAIFCWQLLTISKPVTVIIKRTELKVYSYSVTNKINNSYRSQKRIMSPWWWMKQFNFTRIGVTSCSKRLILLFVCAVSKPSFDLWSHLQGACLFRWKTRIWRDARGMRLVFATCLRPWLFPACHGSLLLPPSSLWTGHGWHSPPLHPSVYSLYHPSVNDSFTKAAVWGSSNACSSF